MEAVGSPWKCKIWKYEMTDWQAEFEMPVDAEILDVQMQGNLPVIWAWHSTGKEWTKETRRFFAVGTGHEFEWPVTGSLRHRGTVQAGDLVWHVFEVV